MEFPFGHSRHHEDEGERRNHHHRTDHEHDRYPQRREFDPPPPQFSHPPPGNRFPQPSPYSEVEHHSHHGPAQVIHHESYPSYGPPPPNPYPRPGYEPQGYGPSGDSYPGQGYAPTADSYPRPGYAPSGDSYPRSGYEPPRGSTTRPLPRGQVVRVFCKANPDFSLAVRNGSAVLVHANANDELQQWIKDETYSTKVKDERSYPSFSLVNKGTTQALKHGLGETQPVLLADYRPDNFDESILWSMSEDMGHGFRTLRQVNNIRLNVDAFHADKKSGGVKDGNPIVLWEWKKGENQLWKIVPY